jgi:hypothetical protein
VLEIGTGIVCRPGVEVTACETPVRQLFVVVENESAGLRMRLAPVQQGGERLAAVNRGVGIVPIEYLGDGDHRPLAETYHVFRRLALRGSSAGGDERLSMAFSTWREALAASGIGLRLERRALYGLPLPRADWGAEIRGIALRPWDVELTAIEAHLRRIVKLDLVPPEFVAILQQNAEQRGLRVEIVTPQGSADDATDARPVTLIVARDESTLVETRGLEQVLLAPEGDPGAAAAALEMGALLGYPRCCVQRFARIAGQNDTTLAWALLPGLPCAPASPLTQWLQPGLKLLSHFPCDLHCAASIALGQRLLDALEAKERGFAARWRSLAARVQVVDQRGNRIALAIDGTLETGRKVIAADLMAFGGPDPDAASRVESLVGREVIPDSGGLVNATCGWYAPYVADHRGNP